MKLAECRVGFGVGVDVLVTEISSGKTKKGDPYLSFQFFDGADRVAGRWWAMSNEYGTVEKDRVYHVTGVLNEYQGVKQIVIDAMAPSDLPAENFMPKSVRAAENLSARIEDHVHGIGDETIRIAVMSLLQGWQDRFYQAPAASSHHHARVGGLAEHTLSMLDTWAALRATIELWHPGLIDNDVMIAAITLHDLGKSVEIESKPGFPYSTVGQMLGHITMGVIAVRTELGTDASSERGLRLLNCIVSHHGKLEWGSPVEPRCPEAVLLHEIDMIDSRLDHYAQLAAKGIQNGWTERDNLFNGQMRGPLETP